MSPERVQLRRTRGWRMPANTVKVDRSSRWGNPFRVGEAGIPDAATAVAHFAAAWEAGLLPEPFVAERIVAELKGKNLACWCPLGSPCHADVLLRVANAGATPP
jgi:hypothetical protein